MAPTRRAAAATTATTATAATAAGATTATASASVGGGSGDGRRAGGAAASSPAVESAARIAGSGGMGYTRAYEAHGTVVSGKTVCVIGAGASGLTTLKTCLEYGLSPVCYEQEPGIGGIWRYTETEGYSTVYQSTVINTSREMNSFSDFPVPSTMPWFLHNTQMVEYLHMYATHFGLLKHISFKHKVLNVTAEADGSWRVTVTPEGGKPIVRVFDAVLVCSGHHWKPHMPDFPGMSAFQGRAMHSHGYRVPNSFANRRVLVVGIGNSGGDIAVEVSRVAKHVYLSTRSGAWITPRILFGKPVDHTTSRFASGLPLVAANMLGKFVTRMRFGDLSSYGLQPAFDPMSAHVTVNDGLIDRISVGSISVRPNIKQVKKNSVVFDDGVEVEVDDIVYATGYDITFSFLDPKSTHVTVDDNKVTLYKYVFPPEVDHRHPLAIIGLIQPLGSILPISEMQARWACSVIAGEVNLPSRDAMLADIHNKAAEMRRRYKASRRHTIQVDYVPYMDEVADHIGVRPNMRKLWLTNPSLAKLVWFGPAFPVQYRLHGPHANPAAAKILRDQVEQVHHSLATRDSPAMRKSFITCGRILLLFVVLFIVMLILLIRSVL